jgi:hypothetical protein
LRERDLDVGVWRVVSIDVRCSEENEYNHPRNRFRALIKSINTRLPYCLVFELDIKQSKAPYILFS